MICSDGSGYGVLVYQLIDPDLGPVFTKEPLDGTDLTCSFYFPGLDLLTANKFNVDQPRDSKGRWMPAGMAKGTGRTPSAAGQSAMVHAALGKKADVSSHVEAINTLRSRGTDLSKEEIAAHVNRLGRHLNKAQVHDVARATGVGVSPTKKDTLAAIHEHLSSRPATSTQASSQAPAAKVGTVSPTAPDSHAELAQATAGKQGFTGPFQRGPYTVVRHDDSGHTIEAEVGNHSGRFAVKDPSNVVHSRHDTAEAAVAAIPGVNRIGTSQGTVDKELLDRSAQVGKSLPGPKPALPARGDAIREEKTEAEGRVRRMGRGWWVKTVDGYDVPSPFATKQKALAYAITNRRAVEARLRGDPADYDHVREVPL